MIYFSSHADLKLMQEFSELFERLRRIEIAAEVDLHSLPAERRPTKSWEERVRVKANEIDGGYDQLRTKYAKMMVRAIELTDAFQVPHKYSMMGTVEARSFSGSIYQAVLDRPTALVDLDTTFRTTVNPVIGALERQSRDEFLQVINPLYWLKQLIASILRLPYSLVEASGFDPKKLEEPMFSVLTKLLLILVIIFVLIKLGVALSDIVKIVEAALSK